MVAQFAYIAPVPASCQWPAGAAFVQFTDDPLNRRTCERCGATSDGSDLFGGPDPCLGRLAGVTAACCGHGRLWLDPPRDVAHVVLEDGRGFAGDEARAELRRLGGSPPDL